MGLPGALRWIGAVRPVAALRGPAAAPQRRLSTRSGKSLSEH